LFNGGKIGEVEVATFSSLRERDTVFRDVTDHWTVLLNFGPFREFGIFDGAIDAERERQLAVDKFRAFQSGESVGEKTLFGGDCRHALILNIVGAGYAHAARAVHVDAVAVNIDVFTTAVQQFANGTLSGSKVQFFRVTSLNTLLLSLNPPYCLTALAQVCVLTILNAGTHLR